VLQPLSTFLPNQENIMKQAIYNQIAVVDGNESAKVEDVRRERVESTWPG
jgi:hypothetical protein